MHSSGELRSNMFGMERDGQPVPSFADLCPGFTAQDRLGVIVHHPFGAVRMSALILAAVTAFYDEQRKHEHDFFIYPDYFIFHVGCKPGNYSMFDIWPEHKCVRIEGDAEDVLRAINDRGISLLVLNQRAGCEGGEKAQLQPHTRNSALSRIRQAFLYLGPQARGWPEAEGTVRVAGNAVVERYVQGVLDQTFTATDAEREAARAWCHDTVEENGGAEWYRRVPADEALGHL